MYLASTALGNSWLVDYIILAFFWRTVVVCASLQKNPSAKSIRGGGGPAWTKPKQTKGFRNLVDVKLPRHLLCPHALLQHTYQNN